MKKRDTYLWWLLSLTFFFCGCRKEKGTLSQSVFVRLFPSDISYQTGGAFELTDGNFIMYGYSPEENGMPPLIIKTDPKGNLLWKTFLTSDFHYCTIKPASNGSMVAAGVATGLSSDIHICTIGNGGDVGASTVYHFDTVAVKSGPLIAPRFEINSNDEVTTIAGTLDSLNVKMFPFLLSIHADGSTELFKFSSIDPGVRLMLRDFIHDSSGYALTGSTFTGSLANLPLVETFYLRLDTGYQKVWDTIFTMAGGSVAAKGMVENTSASSIILYGSTITGTLPNSAVSDLVGTLYTQPISISGITGNKILYNNYQNYSHAAGMAKTVDGFILAASTNELPDFHLISSNQVYLLKLVADLQGNLSEQWHQQFNGFNAFTAVSVIQTSDGGYLVSGYEHTDTFLYTMFLIKTDAKGNILSE